MQEEIDRLLKQLAEAFGDLPIPPEDHLVFDSSGNDPESNEIRVKFSRRHWKDLTIDDLLGEADALAFFTPEAFRFFLPAFIRASLLDPERAGQISDVILWSLVRPDTTRLWAEHKDSLLQKARARGIPEQVVMELAPKEAPEVDAALRARVEAFTGSQRRAVESFVSFLRKHRSGEFRFGELDQVEGALRS